MKITLTLEDDEPDVTATLSQVLKQLTDDSEAYETTHNHDSDLGSKLEASNWMAHKINNMRAHLSSLAVMLSSQTRPSVLELQEWLVNANQIINSTQD